MRRMTGRMNRPNLQNVSIIETKLSAAGPVPFWMAPGSGSGFGSQCKSGMYRIFILLQVIYA